MNFEQKILNYANLLVEYALNIQKGQVLVIGTEAENKDLAILISELAYKKGAKYVELNISDARLTKARILYSKEEYLDYLPDYIPQKFKEYTDNQIAILSLISPEDPDALEGLDAEKLNNLRIRGYDAKKYLYDEGIDKSKIHWVVAAASTFGWGKKIFPDLTKEKAKEKLWDEFFKICRVDKENYIELWREHDSLLSKRAEKLNEMKIKQFHFTGPGTDLFVGLTKKAIFKGGSETSKRGVSFEPNIPTEECFTTPDYRKTNGKVRATRPFRINSQLVKGLELEFKDGVIVSSKAEEGIEAFNFGRNSDEGGSRLGEVALVGIDSPIFQSGLVFDEILLDENASCHIAIGSAYKFCIENGEEMSEEELEEYGVNDSCVHRDIMISSKEVDVFAQLHSGEEIQLIKKGEWVLSI